MRKIYWDKNTGEIIYNVSWDQDPPESTIDQDYESLTSLQGRTKASLMLTIYRAGEYERDFRDASAVRMNPQSGTPEFAYPDPNAPSPPTTPTYQKPLTEEVAELKQAVAELTMMMAAPPVV